MKIVRFQTDRGIIARGIIQENEIREVTAATNLYHPHYSGTTYPLGGVKLLAPCNPSKVVCVGLNYRDHAAELNLDLPTVPVIFLKPPTAVIGPGDDIILPPMAARVDFEAELAIVIGKKAKGVATAEAAHYILGYTCANDVTARDLQQQDGQWTRAKAFDTFCPLGPWIETAVDPHNLEIRLLINGQEHQRSNTNQLIFSVYELVGFISQVMTLLPGDVILTGTPAGIGPLKPRDEVDVTIADIGTLVNNVID